MVEADTLGRRQTHVMACFFEIPEQVDLRSILRRDDLVRARSYTTDDRLEFCYVQPERLNRILPDKRTYLIFRDAFEEGA